MRISDTHEATSQLPVGREREQSLLQDKLAAARAGDGSLVLISGEAGIGKTTLAEGLCQEARAHDAVVLIGRCYDLTETPPYGPWIELFGQYQPEGEFPPLPSAFAMRGTIGVVSSRAALVQQVLDFLSELTAQRPLTLLFEDLHWADSASLDLLRSVARIASTLPLLVVVTYRSDELTRRHPLYAILPTVIREAHADRLDLRSLTEDDVRALVGMRYRLGPAPASLLIRYLQTRAEGNPFFLGELLRALEEAGTLRNTGDGWTLGDLTHAGIPSLLRQVIDGRLTRFEERAQGLLAVAAVIGQEVPFALWATIVKVTEDDLLDVIERAVEAHLLVESSDGARVRFTHALIREAIYERMLATRRRRLHRQIGDMLAESADADPDAVAYHLQQAGDERAAEWLINAGERAADLFSEQTAIDRFERALALFDANASHTHARGWMLYNLARIYRFVSHERAMQYSIEAQHAAELLEDRVLIANVLATRAWLRYDVGELDQGLCDCTAAFEMLESLVPTEESQSAAMRSRSARTREVAAFDLVEYLAFCGQCDQAMALGERWASSVPEISVLSARGIAARGFIPYGNLFFGLQMAYMDMGEPEKEAAARGHATRFYEAAQWDHMLVAIANSSLNAHLAYHADQVEERQRFTAARAALFARTNDRVPDQLRGYVRELSLLMLEGAWTEIRAFTDSQPGLPPTGYRNQISCVLCAIALAQGDNDRAWAIIQALLPDGPTMVLRMNHRYQTAVQRLAAALTIGQGELVSARTWLEVHDQFLDKGGAVLGRSEGQALWARYYQRSGDLSTAREYAERAFTYATEPRQPLALLAAHRLLGELDTDTCRFSAAREHLNTSLALADACKAPYERALNLLALAELHAATGQRSTAMSMLDEVRAICEPLGTKPALARADALVTRISSSPDARPVYPDALSAREVEVLRLIAAGSSNQQIADTLSISVRTVERHITNLYAKVGVDGRAAATAYALRRLS